MNTMTTQPDRTATPARGKPGLRDTIEREVIRGLFYVIAVWATIGAYARGGTGLHAILALVGLAVLIGPRGR